MDDFVPRQRRVYVRSQLPITAYFKGFPLVVLDWSLGGIGIGPTFGIELPEEVGAISDFQLDITLESVTVTLDIPVKLVYVEPDRRGYEFVELSLDQQRVLRSYLMSHGEMLLEVPPASPETKEKARSRLRQTRPQGRRHVSTLLKLSLAAAVLAGVGYVGLSINQLFPGPTLSAFAAVAAPATNMTMPERGFIAQRLIRPGESVAAGDSLFEVYRHGDLSSVVRLKSPCNCVVAEVHAERGDEVSAGETLSLLAGSDDASGKKIEALFPMDAELQEGDEVEVLVQGMDVWLKGVVGSAGHTTLLGIEGLPGFLKSDPRYRLFMIDLEDTDIQFTLSTPATVRKTQDLPSKIGLRWLASADWPIL